VWDVDTRNLENIIWTKFFLGIILPSSLTIVQLIRYFFARFWKKRSDTQLLLQRKIRKTEERDKFLLEISNIQLDPSVYNHLDKSATELIEKIKNRTLSATDLFIAYAKRVNMQTIQD
jgi:hypothetical protein